MAPRDFVSVIAVMTAFMVFLIEIPPLASDLTDITFVETARDMTYDDPETREKNLPALLKLFGVLLKGHDKSILEGLAQDTSPHSVASILTAHETNDLTLLLDKLLSSPSSKNQEEPNGLSTSRHESEDDVFQALPSKRIRDDLSGAMPPLNELCRLMRVQCY